MPVGLREEAETGRQFDICYLWCWVYVGRGVLALGVRRGEGGKVAGALHRGIEWRCTVLAEGLGMGAGRGVLLFNPSRLWFWLYLGLCECAANYKF